MALRTYLCGTSTDVYYEKPSLPARDDADAPRLRTALHLELGQSLACRFRVIARLADGRTALVCLAATRQEAKSLARGRKDFPGDTLELRLQEWVGTAAVGSWRDLGRVWRVRRRARERERQPR